MKNARRAQNGSLKNSLIITYLLMMGVLIGIAAILIVRLLWQFTDDEFERSSNHFAQQLQDNVDGQMLMIYELTQNMGSDTALWSSNLLKEESELLSAYNAIRRYSLSIDIADGFYLFYSNEAMQYVLSDTVLINKIYFDTINANLQLKLEDVQPYFSAQTDLVLETMGDGKHIASIYLLPSDPASRRVAMFLLDATQIEQEIEKAFADDLAYFTLYAQDGKQLFHREYGSQATLVCRPDSQNAVGLSLEIGIVRPQLRRVVDEYRNMLYIYIAVSLPLGLILARLLTRKIYRPIDLARSRILSGAQAQPEAGKGERYREINDIEVEYHQVSSEKARLASLIDVQTAALKVNILNTYLSGKTPRPSDVSAIPAWEWGEGKRMFILVALDQLQAYVSTYDAPNRLAMEEEMMNAFAVLDGLCTVRIATPMNENRQALMLLSPRETVGRDAVLDACRRAMEDILRLTEQTVTVAVGRAFDEWEDMDEQYAQVRRLMYMRLETGWNALLDADCPPALRARTHGDGNATALKNACLVADRQVARQELNRFFAMFYEEEPNPSTFKSAYFQIVTTLMRIARELACGENITFPATDYEPETINQAQDSLEMVLDQILDFVSEEKRHKRANVSQEAIAIMEAQYGDPMLEPEKIAGQVGVSKNYLSNCLKETHQTTVAAMLDEIRMRKSREMLVRTDLLVKEIVLSCGYVDVNNYIRKFKKQEGVTPLQYRKARKEYAK